MYFKIENEDNAAKVREFLENEGIVHEHRDSSHEIVVEEEAEYLRDEIVNEFLDGWVVEKNNNLEQKEIEEAAELLNSILDDIVADSSSIVGEDCSFLSVQESIKNNFQKEALEQLKL